MQGWPACLPGCLASGDCVPEEEGHVHQPGPEAHRHLGPHGPAASPRQLRGACWAPAGSPAGEWVGPALKACPSLVCLQILGGGHSLHSSLDPSEGPGTPRFLRHTVPPSGAIGLLSGLLWTLYLCHCPFSVHSEARAERSFPSHSPVPPRGLRQELRVVLCPADSRKAELTGLHAGKGQRPWGLLLVL